MYEMVPHSWIVECMSTFKIAANVRTFMESSMENWKTELTSSGESLGNVNIRRGIFQGDSLSPLIFVMCMIALSLILRKEKVWYEARGKELKINHILFMDDLKLFGKNKEQIDSLVKTVHIVSKDIGMEFGIKKCAMLVMKKPERLWNTLCGKGRAYNTLDISECKKLAQEEYKRRHDNVARIVHWKLCGFYQLEKAEKCGFKEGKGVQDHRNRSSRGLYRIGIKETEK
ncbi:Hypothetical predicted protein, partial [Paramuricea clavata]